VERPERKTLSETISIEPMSRPPNPIQKVAKKHSDSSKESKIATVIPKLQVSTRVVRDATSSSVPTER
jgi:hypothetical protein